MATFKVKASKPIPGGGTQVQDSVFHDREQAEEEKRRMQREGYHVYIEER